MIRLAFPLFVIIVIATPASAAGAPDRGAQLYQACAACHSLEPERNMTGPSLAGIWGRKAGSLASFHRYSPAIKAASVTWTEETLDAWLRDPAHYIPGNRMTFPGIKDAQARTDLIAYLKSVSETAQAQSGAPNAPMGGMMMGGGRAPNLKKPSPKARVQSISHCGDTYRVATADGETHEFWERNLRFKTDSSPDGPEKGAPAIVGAGMMGDRASVIFAAPEEISAWIKPQC